MANEIKKATPVNPINDLLVERWSPYVFSDKEVSKKDLLALFEAARWAPSSYNEQPWRYIVACKNQKEDYESILSTLVESNQAWAKNAPVLAIGIIMKNLSQTGAENRAALHDLGAASMSICLEATARGLYVHQMIGIEPEKIRHIYALGDDAEAYTGLAIGYPGNIDSASEPFKTRDHAQRTRKQLEEFVFSKSFGRGLNFD